MPAPCWESVYLVHQAGWLASSMRQDYMIGECSRPNMRFRCPEQEVDADTHFNGRFFAYVESLKGKKKKTKKEKKKGGSVRLLW